MKRALTNTCAAIKHNPVTALYEHLCYYLRGHQIETEKLTARIPDLNWCVRGAVDAVALPLPGAPSDAGIEIWIGKDATPSDVPRRVRLDGKWLNLHIGKRPRPQIQSVIAEARNIQSDSGRGTVAGLMRDQLQPERHYVLSCGHVFAGTMSARFEDKIAININDKEFQATLVDWAPVIGGTIKETGIDAAIARIDDAELLAELNKIAKPEGVSATFRFDHPVTVKAREEKTGRLKTRWSGYVDIAATDRVGDYYLTNAIGYQVGEKLHQTTEAGDSGAAVWNKPDNHIIGIHVAAPVGDERWRSNAILCPIDRIMEWFDIEPLTNGGESLIYTTPASVYRAASAMEISPGSEKEIEIVAKTIWGEARGEKEEGMRAVACVIGNRKAKRWRNKDNYSDICLDKWQFSCWNENDPNRPHLEAMHDSDTDFELAMSIARCLLGNQLDDITFGATHYYSTSLKSVPYWAQGKSPCYQLGKHIFFNNID